MSILCDREIKKLALAEEMISPFQDKLISEVDGRRILSYGLSSYGYDIRLSPKQCLIFGRIQKGDCDPKDFDADILTNAELLEDEKGQYFILPPYGYCLGVAQERIKLPRDVTVVAVGKSTYARSGILVNITPAEAEWKGYLTLEISNCTGLFNRIYADEGITQLLFYRGEPCEVSYQDRKGKYQDQKKEIVFSTYICHPSMANNELSGPVTLIALARELQSKNTLNYSYRFLFLPETIGSIAYIHRNIESMKRNVKAGWQITCMGDRGGFSYISSRLGKNTADYISNLVLARRGAEFKKYSFLERGSDERQWCSPGVDLPFASITRSKYGTFDEYHTSLDNLDFISGASLEESADLLMEIVQELEQNPFPDSILTCEPQMGRRGLYPNLSIKENYNDVTNLMNVLAYCDGTLTTEEISKKTQLQTSVVEFLLDILIGQNLVELW
jgi:deoxycytidine triphosphate deaminase